MTITYRSSRTEVARFYRFMWRRSARLKLLQLLIAVGVFITAWLFQAGLPVSSTKRNVVAVLAMSVVIGFLPLYPLLMFKSQERTLAIGKDGLQTTIGNQQGGVAWRDVAEIVVHGDDLYIVRRNFNAFVVPRRAFATADEHDAFGRAAKEWFHNAQSQPAV